MSELRTCQLLATMGLVYIDSDRLGAGIAVCHINELEG